MDGIPPENTQELLESLECPVCKEICPPPLYNCVNGHTVCGKCSERLTKCPLCSGKMTDVRNRVAEDITALLQLKCTNTGCGKCVKGDLFKAHVADECNYRPVACYCETIKKCNGKEIEMSKYEEHLIQDHKISGLDTHHGVYTFIHTQQNVEEISDGNHRIHYIKCDGKLFMLNHWMHQKILYSWVTLVGSEEEAQKYEASLGYYKPYTQVPRCGFTVGVHSFRKTLKSVHTSGEFVGLPNGWLLPLAEKSEKHDPKRRKIDYGWCITIRITRKKG